MRLKDELKEGRMTTQAIQTGPRIVHIDRGSNDQWGISVTSDADMWTPFSIDAKVGDMNTKEEMKTKWEHAHRGSMSCCHQWQRGRLLMKLSLMPTQDVINATKSHLQCLEPLQSGFVPWSTLNPVNKVLVPTRMKLEATTLLKTLKTLEMVLKPW